MSACPANAATAWPVNSFTATIALGIGKDALRAGLLDGRTGMAPRRFETAVPTGGTGRRARLPCGGRPPPRHRPARAGSWVAEAPAIPAD